MNPILSLRDHGQSVWLDYIERDILTDGTFQRFVDQDGICGMTSNPAIFAKAIVGNDDYAAAIAKLTKAGADTQTLYEQLALEDVRLAASQLATVYQNSAGRDGYVSLEVSPLLAHDTEASLAEARRLWQSLDLPNAMIKIPATRAGLPVIQQLIAEGINVNVTLLFSVERYAAVAEAYMQGLETRVKQGQNITQVASVASFFLSRIDVKVDRLLDDIADSTARDLRGQLAVAQAGLAYAHFEKLSTLPRWQALAQAGARSQRLLWASTSTKDPDYSDVKYVEALIGPETVNTLPMDTLQAYRDHGNPAPRLAATCQHAPQVMRRVAGLPIDLATIAEELEAEGIEKFIKPYQTLLATLEQERQRALQS